MFAELDALHAEGHEFTAISEERGVVTYGDGASAGAGRDRPDRRLPERQAAAPDATALSIAVASGDTMEDVEFAFVHDFGTGEEFVARRDGGATLNGQPLDAEPAPARHGLEVVGLESARPEWLAAGRRGAGRLRSTGCA